MHFCRKQLTAYQRKALRSVDILMGISIAVSILLQAILFRHNPSLGIRFAMACVAIIPVFASIVAVARYLRGEIDEYMRQLVIESILWGLGAVLIADAFLGCLGTFHPDFFPIPMGSVSLNIFVFAAAGTLERKLWSSQ